MAQTLDGAPHGSRSLEVFFHPGAHRYTHAEVLVVDYRGDRRTARRVGSLRLGLGPSDLVGLTPSEVTFVLVQALYEWLLLERGELAAIARATDSRAAAPAPPEGGRGAALIGCVDNPLPGL